MNYGYVHPPAPYATPFPPARPRQAPDSRLRAQAPQYTYSAASVSLPPAPASSDARLDPRWDGGGHPLVRPNNPPRMQAHRVAPPLPPPHGVPEFATTLGDLHFASRRSSVESDPCGDAFRHVQWEPLREMAKSLQTAEEFGRLHTEVKSQLQEVIASGVMPLFAQRWREETNALLYILYNRSHEQPALFAFADALAEVQWEPLREMANLLQTQEQFALLYTEVKSHLQGLFARGVSPPLAQRWRQETSDLLYTLYDRSYQQPALVPFADALAVICARGNYDMCIRALPDPDSSRSALRPAFMPFLKRP